MTLPGDISSEHANPNISSVSEKLHYLVGT